MSTEEQGHIADLEAQVAQLTTSLETASTACMVLKQQQREGWAQFGATPVDVQKRVVELESAIKKLHKAKGRYNSQNAVCDLYDLLGLHTVRTDQSVQLDSDLASGQGEAMKLTNNELYDVYEAAAKQPLLPKEIEIFLLISRAIEAAVLAKLADKLHNAARYEWLRTGDNDATLIVADKNNPYLLLAEKLDSGIDDAMLAEKVKL